MRKTFDFGKIDANGIGRRINPVEVKVELEYKNGKPVFSAMAFVYNQTRTDCIAGGQCLDEIVLRLLNNKEFVFIYKMWKLHHLNDLHAGTKEQEEALKGCKSKDYKERCDYLKSKGLYEVMHDGKPYRYGSGWLYEEIPAEDLQKIIELLS